jgi:hypothetical protein
MQDSHKTYKNEVLRIKYSQDEEKQKIINNIFKNITLKIIL